MEEIMRSIRFPDGRGVEKYPWEQWFDGGIWQIKQGEDFQVDIGSMRSCIYTAAKRYKKKIRTHVPRQKNMIYVQATGNLKTPKNDSE